MSGPKASRARTLGEISAEALRAAQREAARLAHARRQEKRQRREAQARIEEAQRQLADAKTRFKDAHDEWFRVVEIADRARAELTDFSAATPIAPTAPVSDYAEDWSAAAGSLEAVVRAMRVRVEQAVLVARRVQARREAGLRAWKRYREALDRCSALSEDLTELTEVSGRTAQAWTHPEAPAADAEPDDVARAAQSLEARAESLQRQLTQLQDVAAANEALHATIERVIRRQRLVSAQEAIAGHRASGRAASVREFEKRLEENLRRHGVVEEDLPLRLRRAMADVRHGDVTAESAGLWHGIDRHVYRMRERERASALLATPPFIEDEDLGSTWADLVPELDRVVSGHSELTPSLERAVAALISEAKRRMASRFTRAAILAAIEECGFAPVDREDIAFDDAGGQRSVFALREFPDHGVYLDTTDDRLLWIPFRTDDDADSAAIVRDAAFDAVACTRLHESLRRAGAAAGPKISAVEPLAEPGERQVQLASDMTQVGVRVVKPARARTADRVRSIDPKKA